MSNMLQSVTPQIAQCSVNSVDLVRRKSLDCNDCVETRLSAGWHWSTVTANRDVDLFFNGVPRELIFRSVDWLVATWGTVIGRRCAVRVPRVKPRKAHTASYSTCILSRCTALTETILHHYIRRVVEPIGILSECTASATLTLRKPRCSMGFQHFKST